MRRVRNGWGSVSAMLAWACCLGLAGQAAAQPPAVPARTASGTGSAPDSAASGGPALSPADVPPPPPLTVDVLERGSSSRSTLHAAEQALPLATLTPAQRTRVDDVLRTRSLYRRLPRIAIDASPEIYRYFTQHPEAAVGIWQVLKISKFQMHPQSPTVWLGDAGDGSTGTIELLYRDDRQQLLLCEGEYKSPLLPRPIRAQALMYLRTEFRETDPRIVHDLELFVAFPSQTVETVARVIAPVSHLIADRNFHELSLFVRFMHLAMEYQPGWVEQLVQQIQGIDRDQRDRLLKLTAQVYVAARSRPEPAGVVPAGLDELITPFQQGAGTETIPAAAPVIRAAGTP